MGVVRIISSVVGDISSGGAGVGGGGPESDYYLWVVTVEVHVLRSLANSNLLGPWPWTDNGVAPDARVSAIALDDAGGIYASAVKWTDRFGKVKIVKSLQKSDYDPITKSQIKVTAKGYDLLKVTKAVTETVNGFAHTKTSAFGKIYLSPS